MDVFKLKVFPAANIFPMLADDELDELAADIKQNGLRDPLVVGMIDGELMLIDGRNRRAACKKANVEPVVRELNGEDATAFVISANVHRRHLTKSQRAMAVAMVFREPEKGGRGKKRVEITSGVFSEKLLSQARYVLANAPDIAKAVLDGGQTLGDAHADTKQRLKESNSDESRLALIRTEAPDISEYVERGTMKLSEAFAAYEQRKHDQVAEEESKRETLQRVTESACQSLLSWANEEFIAEIRERLAIDAFRNSLATRVRVTPKDVDLLVAGADALVSVLRDLKLEGR